MSKLTGFLSQYTNDIKFALQGVKLFLEKVKDIRYYANKMQFSRSQQLDFISDFSSFYQTSSAADAAKAIIISVEEAGDKPLKKIVAQDILDSLNQGHEVSDGMSKWFAKDALQIYRAGEKAGRIQQVIAIYAQQFQQIRKFKLSIISNMKLGLVMTGIGLSGLLALAKADWLNFDKIKPVVQWPEPSRYAYDISYMLNDNLMIILISLAISWKAYTYFLANNTSSIRIAVDNYFPLSMFKGLEGLRFIKMLAVLKNANVGDYNAIRIIHENSCKYMRYYTEKMQDNLNQGRADLSEVLDVGLLPPRLMSRLGSVSKASGNEAKLKSLMVVSDYAEKEIEFSLKKSSVFLAAIGWVVGGFLLFTLLVGFMLTTLSFSSM